MVNAIDIPKEFERACKQAGDLLFIPAGLLTHLGVGYPIGRFVHVYDTEWTIIQEDKQHGGWLAKHGTIARNTYIGTQDKHAADGQYLSLSVILAVGPWRIWPVGLTLGPKLQEFYVLRIGRYNGWRKPSALLGAMHWNGNGKLMWSIDLLFVGLERVKGRGVDARYLR